MGAAIGHPSIISIAGFRFTQPNLICYGVYKAMGFPVEMFPVLFTIPRTSGWLAQWLEMLEDTEQKIIRPRQVCMGADNRNYVALKTANKVT